MRKVKIFTIVLCLGCFSSFASKVKHVVLISIDGFRPEFYTQERWPTPNLKYLAQQGAQANGVRTIFPSVTYPSHTTLSTGVLPDKHQVEYNTQILENGQPGNWIYHSKDVATPTIWQWAKESGLTTASVSWPVTLDNIYIDYNLPEIWNFDNPRDRISATKMHSNPKGLFEQVMQNALGDIQINDFNLSSLAMDQNLGRSASYILKTFRPNLLTLHLPCTDGAQHQQGRDGYEVQKAVAGADYVIGDLIQAAKQAGIFDSTVFIVTGDHGFVSTEYNISPNIWLKQAGLLERAFFFSTGGSTVLQVRDPKDKKIVQQVQNIIENLPPRYLEMFEIIDQEQIIRRGGPKEAKLALSGKLGYSFSNNSQEDELLSKTSGGKHGYYPNFHQIYTGFIAYGPGIEKGLVIDVLNLEDIAPTIANLLGIESSDTDGIVIPLFKK